MDVDPKNGWMSPRVAEYPNPKPEPKTGWSDKELGLNPNLPTTGVLTRGLE